MVYKSDGACAMANVVLGFAYVILPTELNGKTNMGIFQCVYQVWMAAAVYVNAVIGCILMSRLAFHNSKTWTGGVSARWRNGLRQ